MKSSQKQASPALPLTRRLAALGLFLALLVLCGSGMGFPQKATASITAIDTTSGVITAKENATGHVFQFNLTNPTLLRSLNVGQAIFVDIANKWVSLDGSRINGNIVSLGPVDGGKPAGPVDGAKPVGPVDGVKPVGPIDGAKPAGPVDGVRPLGPADGAKPVGPIDGVKPAGPVDGAKPLGPVDGAKPAGPVDGAHRASFSDGGVANSTITSIDTSRGLVTARDNQTGRTVQFRPNNASFLQSLKVGQPVVIEFATNQVSLTNNGNRTIIGSIVNAVGNVTHK
jgi:hypothetical protein